MLTHTFIFNLPCSNHVHRLSDVKFEIKATLDDFGHIYFTPPTSEDILNEEEMHRDIIMLARMEFEKKEERIADGNSIVNDVLGGSIKNTLFQIIIFLVIGFVVFYSKIQP